MVKDKQPSLGAREFTFIDPNVKSKKIRRIQSSQPEDIKLKNSQKLMRSRQDNPSKNQG